MKNTTHTTSQSLSIPLDRGVLKATPRAAKESEKQSPIQPVHTCTEQSPVCLIADHVGPCLHRHCLLAYKKPKYWGLTIAEFYKQHDFSEFDVFRESLGPAHIIPKNPNPKAEDDFEFFRQSQNAIIHLAGSWPINITSVAREHVVFKWAEHIESVPSFNFDTLRNEWKLVLDVSEFAYYIAPLDGLELSEVDINAFNGPQELSITMASANKKGDCDEK